MIVTAPRDCRLVSLQAGSRQVAIDTNTLSFEAQGTKKRDARRIGGGTGIGAAIGAIAGGGSGAAKGAAIGAGVGVGATLLTKGKEVQFEVEQQLSFSLKQEVQLGG